MPSILVICLIATGVVALLGLALILYDLSRLLSQLRFTRQYASRFTDFVNTWASPNQYDTEAYDWLLKRSMRMQAELGPMSYKPPGSLAYIDNYLALVNTLPNIANGTAHPLLVQQVAESLVRHGGMLEDAGQTKASHLLNPVRWLLRGLEIPGRLLVAFGVVRSSVGEGPIFRLITLVGIVLGILATWDPATSFLRSHHVIP